MNKKWKEAWYFWYLLLNFLRGLFKKAVAVGTIAVDESTGTIFGPGEEIPKGARVVILKRGIPAGTVVLEGEICEDPGSIWRRRYRVTRSYYLTERFFTEAERMPPEDRELWRVDLKRLHSTAATELSAITHGVYDYAKRDQEYFDLYEWCGEPLREEKMVTIMNRYSENHI
jgi:hypothetical protein